MIKKLRIKFIAVTMGVLLALFIILFAALNISVYMDSIKQTDMLLENIINNDGKIHNDIQHMEAPQNMDFPQEKQDGFDGKFPGGMGNFGADGMRGTFFYAKTNDSYEVTESSYNMMPNLADADIEYYVSLAVASGQTRGSVESLEFQIGKKDYGYIVAFAERSVERGILWSLMSMSLIISGISFVVLAVFVFFLSGWIIRPVKDAFDKQRRFISDASHELKTPLTIISANADVLISDIGEKRELSHIKSQTERMGLLVHDLLDLAKTDEQQGEAIFSTFDISAAVLSTTLEFESTAFEEDKTLNYDISSGLFYKGDEGKIRQLTAILIDNAIKHSNKKGQIDIKLSKANQHIIISVGNSGSTVPAQELEKIFERFYRSDTSRSRETGGYGLGLAIAKSIAELHKGKISAATKGDNYITFTAVL